MLVAGPYRLAKRPGDRLSFRGWAPPDEVVWLGITILDQQSADHSMLALLASLASGRRQADYGLWLPPAGECIKPCLRCAKTPDLDK